MLKNYQQNPKVAALDSIMKSQKLSALMKEAMSSNYGHPSRVKAKKLFDATSAASNNYFADGQGGIFDGSTGYFSNPFSSQQQGTAPMTTPTFTPPPMPTGGATSMMLSSPMSAVSAKKSEMQKSSPRYTVGPENYDTLPSTMFTFMENVGAWLGNTGIDLGEWFSGGGLQKFAGDVSRADYSRTNPFIRSRQDAGAPRPQVKTGTSTTTTTTAGKGEDAEQPLEPQKKWSADELQRLADAAKTGDLGALDILTMLGLNPQHVANDAMQITPEQLFQSQMNRMYAQNQGTSSQLSGGSSLEAMSKSAPGINTFIQQAMPEMNKMFEGLPEDQRPYGVADLGQIPVLNATLRKELDLDNQLNRIRTMQSNNSNIEGDLRDYIKGKDQNLKNVDKMLDKAKVDMLNLDLSDPHTAKRAQSYMDYLNILKTRTETRYNDFLTESADIYQKRLDSNINLYNDSLTKYQELFTQGSNVIRDNYQIAVGYLTDMYNNAQNANSNMYQEIANQNAAIVSGLNMVQTFNSVYGVNQGDTFNQDYFENQKKYAELFKYPQYNDVMKVLDFKGSEKLLETFKGSVDDAMAAASTVGLDPKGAVLQYVATIGQNFLDTKFDDTMTEEVASYYAPIISDFIAAHANDTTNGEFYNTAAAMMKTALQEGIKPIMQKADSEKIRTAILELTSIKGSSQEIDAWLQKYGTPGSGDYIGKIMADAILAYYSDKAKSSSGTQAYKDPGQYFADFDDPSRPGMQYESFKKVPLDVIKDELLPIVVDSYFYTLGYR